jgi:16S rRNA C967 or C1407 C5-methylase (RsmB/RsmF family)/NOL1/NOP2/fmu family ribosome biogenesis protein
MSNSLPPLFVKSIPLPDNEKIKLVDAILGKSPVSVRFNTKKAVSLNTLPHVAWHPDGYYLLARPRFTSDPAFHAGAYYPQEASSMFLHHILTELNLCEDPIAVLDLCAAPGGKSTLLRSALHPESFLLANEVVGIRVNLLEENLTKWGIPGFAITQNDPFRFNRVAELFDVVVVDAPCSGEGLFRKDANAVNEWSPQNVEMCAQRQRQILSGVWPALKPGGYLIYSTCTYNEIENEENIKWLLEKGDVETVSLSNIQEGIITSGNGFGYRFFPHFIQGEGFFTAVVRKDGKPRDTKPGKDKLQTVAGILKSNEVATAVSEKGDVFAVKQSHLSVLSKLQSALNLRHTGLPVGKWSKGQFKPGHGIAMLCETEYSIPSIEVNIDQALSYLKRDDLSVSLSEKGIYKVTFEGFTLGLARSDGHRILSQYPMDWRIRAADSSEYTPIAKAL